MSFLYQIQNNSLTRRVFMCLRRVYSEKKVPRRSLENQVKCLEKIVSMEIVQENYKTVIGVLKNRFICTNRGLVDSVKNIMHQIHIRIMNHMNFFDLIGILNLLLVHEFRYIL